MLVQSATPNVALPEGFEIATLGRLALRVAGMSAAEALSFSRAIDWRATLLVPVPVQGGSYREVDVAGETGLLVTFVPPAHAGAGRLDTARAPALRCCCGRRRQGLRAQRPGQRLELLDMAQSVR